MPRITNNVTLAHIDTITDGGLRIIVDRDGSESPSFAVDELSRVLELPELKKTQYVGNDPDVFIKTILPESELLWDGADNPVTIYCDGITLTEVFTHLTLHRFGELNESQLRELLFIYCVDRDHREGWASWEGQSSITELGLSYARELRNRDPRLVRAFEKGCDQQSISFSIMKYLNGQDVGDRLVTTIRRYLATVIYTMILGIESRFSSLHYTTQLERIRGCPTGQVPADTRPIDSYGTFNVPGGLTGLEERLADPNYLSVFKPWYSDIQSRLSNTVTGSLNVELFINETLTPVRLLQMKDTELIEAYLNAFDEIDRVSLLLPSRELSLFSLNLLQWVLQLRRRNHDIPTPV